MSPAAIARDWVQAYVAALVERHGAAATGAGALALVAVTYVVGVSLARLAADMRIDHSLRRIPLVAGGLPFFGHALQLMHGRPWNVMCLDWPGLLQAPMVRFNRFRDRVLLVTEPAMLKRVLQTQQRKYIKHGSSYQDFMCLLGSGLVTSENEKWRRGRTLLTHAMRIDVLEDLPAVALASADVVLHQLEAAAKAGEKADMAKAFHRLTLQVIGRAVLSLPAEECDRVFPSLYLPIVDECNRRVWEPWRYAMPWLHDYRRHSQCLGDLNKYLTDLIQTRWAQRQRGERDEAKGVKSDVLDLYMSQIQKMDGDMVRQLRDDIKTMLLAGHETTAAMLTWTLYELLANPELAAKVREEHHAVLGHIDFAQGQLPTLADIGKLTWTLASLREALRLYSVVPLVLRQAVENDLVPAADTGLGHDLLIPKGTAIAVGITSVHMNPKYWPNPTRYDPSRFVGLDMDTVQYCFLPFINGPRNCLGQHLSLTEAQLVLSYIMGRTRLGLPDGFKAVPHKFMAPQVPEAGLPVHVQAATPMTKQV